MLLKLGTGNREPDCRGEPGTRCRGLALFWVDTLYRDNLWYPSLSFELNWNE